MNISSKQYIPIFLTVRNKISMKNVIKRLDQLSHRGTGTLTILRILFLFRILFLEKNFLILFKEMMSALVTCNCFLPSNQH